MARRLPLPRQSPQREGARQVFSSPSFQSHQHAGVRSRLAGIGGQKTKRTQARLGRLLFDSHIRATNAPAWHLVNHKNPAILSREKIGTGPRLLLRALTRSLPLILPYRAPCGSLPSGSPSRLGRVRNLLRRIHTSLRFASFA